MTASAQSQLPRVQHTVLAVGALLIAASAWLPEVSDGGRQLGPGALLPPLVAVVLTLGTGRLILSLASASLAGAAVLHGPLMALPMGLGRYVIGTLADPVHLSIIGFASCLLAMVAVMNESGGTRAVVAKIQDRIASRERTQVGGALMGCTLFFDDYANCMIVGPALRPLFDRFSISRARLAFVVDATAAPVAGLVPLSTWVGYEIGLLDEIIRDLDIETTGFALLLQMLPYRFYCIFALGLVFITALTGREFGPMLVAERKRLRAGPRPPDGRDLAAKPTALGQPRDAVVPMTTVIVLVAGGLLIDGGAGRALMNDPSHIASLAFWRQTLSAAHHSAQILLLATACGLLLSVVVPASGKRATVGLLVRAAGSGLRVALGAVTILLLAWTLAAVCGAVGTGPYLAGIVGDHLVGWAVPLVTFATAAGVAFATGTSWGTMAMLLPTALPLAYQLGDPWLVAVTGAAVLDGAIFGDHCSPISDTTLMSSIAAECNHLEHVRTQIPYASLAMAAALTIGYGATLMGAPAWSCWLLGLGAMLLFVFLRGRRPDAPSSPPEG